MIYRWFAALDDALVDGLEWFDAAVGFRVSAFYNALYEGLLDRVAPHMTSGISQKVRGHNHTRTADGGYGGRPIARNAVWQAGLGEAGLWKVTVAGGELNTWIAADRDAPTSRTANGISQVEAPVSPGMTSPTGSPPASAPYMDSYVYVYWSTGGGAASVDFRWVNNTTGYNSEVTNISTASQDGWQRLTKIPCTGGQDNDMELQLRSDTAMDIYVNRADLSETIKHEDEEVCVAASTGGTVLL